MTHKIHLAVSFRLNLQAKFGSIRRCRGAAWQYIVNFD